MSKNFIKLNEGIIELHKRIVLVEEFLKYTGYGILSLVGYTTSGVGLPLSIGLSFLPGAMGFTCSSLGDFARSTLKKSVADEVQMRLVNDVLTIGAQLKKAPKLINKIGEVAFKGNEDNLVTMASIKQAKDVLTCNTIANNAFMGEYVEPMALTISDLQRETLRSCTNSCWEEHGSVMVTEIVSEYGRSAGSIAANVTEICGNCCKDHIVEASTVVTEEFASEASSSAAKWWIAQASLTAGRNAMTGFL